LSTYTLSCTPLLLPVMLCSMTTSKGWFPVRLRFKTAITGYCPPSSTFLAQASHMNNETRSKLGAYGIWIHGLHGDVK
ncbi:hypothetical protein Dimus_010363, partial [Dionaea muscipula]